MAKLGREMVASALRRVDIVEVQLAVGGNNRAVRCFPLIGIQVVGGPQMKSDVRTGAYAVGRDEAHALSTHHRDGFEEILPTGFFGINHKLVACYAGHKVSYAIGRNVVGC